MASLPGTWAAHAASADVPPSSSGPMAAAHDGGQLLAPKAGAASAPALAPSRPGPVSQESTTAPANRGGGSAASGGNAAAAARPNAPSRENIVAALRRLIEGLDTEDNYELCLDKVPEPSLHRSSPSYSTLTGHSTDVLPLLILPSVSYTHASCWLADGPARAQAPGKGDQKRGHRRRLAGCRSQTT